jgi:hypothetical protein
MKINFNWKNAAVIAIVSSASFSSLADLEVKLLCSVRGVTQSTYVKEEFKEEFVAEISEMGNSIYILTDSENIGSVGTKRHEQTVSVTNLSDSNRWDLYVETRSTQNKILANRIIIDRNTGLMTTRSTFGEITVTSTGRCSKVNRGQRLF